MYNLILPTHLEMILELCPANIIPVNLLIKESPIGRFEVSVLTWDLLRECVARFMGSRQLAMRTLHFLVQSIEPSANHMQDCRHIYADN
jgi:hypothetical protein